MKHPVPITLTCVIAVGLALSVGGCRQAASVAHDKTVTIVSVDVLAAQPTTMQKTVTQPATVHAYYETRVFAKAAGYLADLRVDIGSTVKQGDVLAVIGIPEMDKQREAKLAVIRRLEANQRRAGSQLAVARASAASYQAKLAQSQAEVVKADAGLVAARVELDRVKDLVKQRAVADRLEDEAQQRFAAAAAEKTAAEAAVGSAEAELVLGEAESDAAVADLDVANAMTDVSRRELDELDELIKYAKVIAPFDGVVTHRNVDPGDLIRNTQSGSSDDGPPLFVVAKLDRVRVRVAVPERDVPLATIDDAVRITLQALPGQVFEGTISRVAGVLDEQTRTMLVEIDLPNPGGHLRPGMFGQATITLDAPGDTLTLPVNAVRFDEHGASYVFLVNAANEVEIAEVETGLDNGEHIEITAGLAGGEQVIGPLLRRLKPGQTVHVN